MEGNLTKGPILKTLTKLAVPIMASAFLGTLYNITDMAWIGLLGSRAVAGVGVGGMFTRQMVGFFQLADTETYAAAMSYTRIACGLIVFSFLTLTLTGIYTAQGDSKTPFLANLVGLVTNMILDPVLILGPGIFPRLGVTGAAIATVTAQAIVMSIMILGIIVQKKENVLKETKLFAKLPREYVSGICKIGIPTAIQGMAYCAISMVLTRMVSGYGAEAIATQRVGGQIESVSWNTADGFGAALNAFIAQNYGAGKNDRVRKGYKASLWTVGIWGVLISVIFICFPEPIAQIFFHEPKAIATAMGYLVIIGFSEAFMCVELTTVGALSGLGRTRLCSIISIAFTSARIPLAILLGGIMGLNGIWWALSSTSIVKGIIFTSTFFMDHKKKKVNSNTNIKKTQGALAGVLLMKSYLCYDQLKEAGILFFAVSKGNIDRTTKRL